MKIIKKLFLVALSAGLLSVPSQLEKVEAAQPETLYLTPNANWKQSNARFAAYFFGNGETWVSMTDTDGDKIYEVAVPTSKTYPSVIFCRMNPSAAANNWNNKWNQTADLTIPTNGNNHYTVKSGTWDKGGGTWSKYAPQEPETPTYQEVAQTVSSYYNEGVYLKETVINLNDEAVNELNVHGGFHADADDLVRVTQYNKDMLTMTIPGNNEYESNYGTDTNGNLTHWGKGGTAKAVISKPTSAATAGNWKNWSEGGMEGYYWTLKDIIPTEAQNWSKNVDGVYSSTDATVIEWFKAIVAPCYLGFKDGTKNYITLTKVEVEDLGETLQLRLLASGDNDKLTNNNGVFAQANISKTTHNYHVKGLIVNDNHSYECVFCREHGYSLVGSPFENWNVTAGVAFESFDATQVKLTVELDENDEVKIHSSHQDDYWKGYYDLKPECQSNFGVKTGEDNIIIKTAGTYDIYLDVTSNQIWMALATE